MASDEAMAKARDQIPCAKCIECRGNVAALIEERDGLRRQLAEAHEAMRAARYAAIGDDRESVISLLRAALPAKERSDG